MHATGRARDSIRRVLPPLLVVVLAPAAVLMTAHLAGGEEASHPWVRQFGTLGHDAATGVAVDEARNVYIAGWTSGVFPAYVYAGGTRDAYVRKYDAAGTELWTRQFGTPGADAAMQVAADNGGNVYVAGQVGGRLAGQTATGEFDAYVRKYDRDGGEKWTSQFGSPGGAAANSLLVDETGAVYVAGWVNGALPGQTSAGQSDAYVRKYDSSGAEVWTHQFGDAEKHLSVAASGLFMDSNRGISVWTQTALADGRYSSSVRRYTPAGVEVWTRRLPLHSDENPVSGQVDPAGNIYVTGILGGHHHADGFIRKYSPDGKEVWVIHTSATGMDGPDMLAADRMGNIYAIGQSAGQLGSQASDGDNHAVAAAYDANGTQIWQTSASSAGQDIATALAVDAVGNVYVVGWTTGALPGQVSAGLTDAFVARMSGVNLPAPTGSQR